MAARAGEAMRALRSVAYAVTGRVATITLNRPTRLNAIDAYMPAEIARCVAAAEADDDVHAVVLTGAGRSFCAGYDLIDFAEEKGDVMGSPLPDGSWCPMRDHAMMHRNTLDFMSLFRASKPTIAKVRGHAVAGGSDIALCCDLVVCADDARIGYPPARVWGVPTTAMWVYRLGPEKAKRMLFTGDVVTGAEAAGMGLVLESVPEGELDERVEALARRVSSVPRNQLAMTKLLVNQAVEAAGLSNTQHLATLFDGVARHSPEGRWFKQRAEEVGFKQAVRERDSGEPIAAEAELPSYQDPHGRAKL